MNPLQILYPGASAWSLQLMPFADIPMRDDFISPEGSLFEKVSQRVAILLDDEDPHYTIGQGLVFGPLEMVEHAPKELT